jgi:hypothetical protein
MEVIGMALVKIEANYTGTEASQFVAALAHQLVERMDLDELLEYLVVDPDIVHAAEKDDLENALLSALKNFTIQQDEEIVEWVVGYLTSSG